MGEGWEDEMRFLAACVMAVALSSGCGDDGPPEAERTAPYVEAYAESMIEPEDPDEDPVPEDAANCFAQRVVAIVGIDALEGGDVSPEDFAEADDLESLDVALPEEATDEVADAIEDCMADELRESFVDGIGRQASGDASCMFDALDPEFLYRASAEHLIHASDDLERTLLDETVASTPAECFEEILISESLGDGDIDETQAACIADELEAADVVPLFEAAFDGEEASPEDVEPMIAAYRACGAG